MLAGIGDSLTTCPHHKEYMKYIKQDKANKRQHSYKKVRAIKDIKRRRSVEKLGDMLDDFKETKSKAAWLRKYSRILSYYESFYEELLDAFLELMDTYLKEEETPDPFEIDPKDKYECGYLDGHLSYYREMVRKLEDLRRELK